VSLFNRAIDYSGDIFRNIRGIHASQNLFDDLSEDPLNWEAANNLDIDTHPVLKQPCLSVIQRPFDYSKNEFLDYPFENITSSRFSDGSTPCWYGSEALETTIYETKHHFIQEILDAWEAYQGQKTVCIDRRVARVHCYGLAFDLSSKAEEFPWLVDKENYLKCQEIGKRIAKEGHSLLRVPSARHEEGINLVAFSRQVLSNPREHCLLRYTFELTTQKITVSRGEEALKV
jgi:hypothetical protein